MCFVMCYRTACSRHIHASAAPALGLFPYQLLCFSVYVYAYACRFGYDNSLQLSDEVLSRVNFDHAPDQVPARLRLRLQQRCCACVRLCALVRIESVHSCKKWHVLTCAWSGAWTCAAPSVLPLRRLPHHHEQSL